MEGEDSRGRVCTLCHSPSPTPVTLPNPPLDTAVALSVRGVHACVHACIDVSMLGLDICEWGGVQSDLLALANARRKLECVARAYI
jgi:hypothetical protein